MRILKKISLKNKELEKKNVYKRIAARGIILDGENLLLLYTKKYDDYSFPGGGVDKNENLVEAVKREINEETGAKNIEVLSEYGVYDEIITPLNRINFNYGMYNAIFTHLERKNFDYIYMTSHFFLCSVDSELGKPQLEDYEEEMGIKALWINIYDAIAHNKKIQKEKPISMSRYLERELFVLELVAKELENENI